MKQIWTPPPSMIRTRVITSYARMRHKKNIERQARAMQALIRLSDSASKLTGAVASLATMRFTKTSIK